MQLNIFGQVSEHWIMFCFYVVSVARSVVCCNAEVSLMGGTPRHTSILLMLLSCGGILPLKTRTVSE